MLKDITIGQYIPGNSFIHKLDPRTKIVTTFMYIISLFIIDNFIGYIVAAALLGICIINAKISVKVIFRGLKPIFFLIILTAVLNLFMNSGENIIFEFGFIKIYQEGVRIAVFMAVRLILLIIGTSMLTYTTSPIELTDGIEKLLKPIGKNLAHELAMMMTIALRFIPTLTEETDKIMKAQKARGANFETGKLIDRARSLIPILIPLFISSFRRADELAMAMEARCYRGGEGRTRMKKLKFTYRDFIAYIIFACILLLCIYVRIAY